MQFLYVFPHPDDESFGPALAIAKQHRQGHSIHLLTLTRGGATKERMRLGVSVEEMGVLRRREMDCVASVLSLASLEVCDFPDGGLASVPDDVLQKPVRDALERHDPDVVVTYPSHGISGHRDHLRTHRIVSDVFEKSRSAGTGPGRLAFFTLLPVEPDDGLHVSARDRVGCAIDVEDADVAIARRALACYETYASTIQEKNPIERVGRTVYFELHEEHHDPWLSDLAAELPSR